MRTRIRRRFQRSDRLRTRVIEPPGQFRDNWILDESQTILRELPWVAMKQAVQMFVPAQYAVAKAVADCVAEGTIPATAADELVIVCGVFLHPSPGRGQRQDRQVQPRGHQARHPAGHEELAGHCRDHRTEGQGRAPLCQVSVAKSRVGARCRDRETSAPRHWPNRTRAAMVPSDAERAYHPIRP